MKGDRAAMFRTRAKVTLMALAALSLIACQGGTLGGGRGGQGGGSLGGAGGSTGGGAGQNLVCDMKRPASPARLGVLLLLDASASMNDDGNGMTCSGGCGATSQWALATGAINTVVGLTATSFDWGLKVFGDATPTCGVRNAVEVAQAPDAADAIATTLTIHTGPSGGVGNGGNRPTRAAEQAAASYLSTLSDLDRRIIVLVTDGVPGCATDATAVDDADAAVQAAADAARLGFTTSVIGIATGGTAAEATLTQMAGSYAQFAGGRYVPVSDSAGATAALRSIVDDAGTCLFTIPPPPNNQLSRGFIGVVLSGNEIPLDPTHVNGWDYTDNSEIHFQLFGAACQAALMEPPAPLEVVYRCEL